MKLSEHLKTALVGLKTNKTRTALTMLGIVIGITAVIVMISIGSGAQEMIIGQIASMGSNNIFIEPGSFDPNKRGEGGMMQSMTEVMQIKTLKYSDAVAISKDPTIEFASPAVFGTGRVVYKNNDKKINFMGITSELLEINDTHLTLGRPFTDGEVKSMARVAVLGYKVRQDLFGETNPLGKMVRIQKTNFKVIGVAEEQGMQMFQNLDENVYIPITTAQKLLLGIDHILYIVAKAKSEGLVDQAVENIRLTLRERHNINNPEGDLSKDDFKVMSQKEAADMLSSVIGIFTLFLSSVAAIALVVGGIGIMNIMLVTVSERTREIGLRKAVGARKKDILWQFLLEAMVLTIFGGIIGIVFGVVLSWLGSILISRFWIENWIFTISPGAIALAFGVAATIGLVFGIYPARKAAKLSPIEALRYE